MDFKTAAAAAALIGLAGCASSSKDVMPHAVSTIGFQNYDCRMLAAEHNRLSTEALNLAPRLDKAAANDQLLTAASFIFWPSAMFLGNKQDQEARYGYVTGQMHTIEQVAITKNCPISPSAPVPLPASYMVPASQIR